MYNNLTYINMWLINNPYMQGILKGEYHCTIDLLFDWLGINCMTTDNFCFYLQNRLIQTSQTGGQQYSDTSPFSIPWYMCPVVLIQHEENFEIFIDMIRPVLKTFKNPFHVPNLRQLTFVIYGLKDSIGVASFGRKPFGRQAFVRPIV